jgi:hypothetical protein
MKALKTLGILLILLLILGLIAALILPKELKVERSITIKASPDVVWEYISKHEHYQKWSPWHRLDSALNYDIVGNDGTVGATLNWSSELKKVGTGAKTFTLIDRESGMIEASVRFKGMGPSKSWRYINVVDGGTTVTWGWHNAYIGIPSNLFIFLFGARKSVNQQFEQGLVYLKEICEADLDQKLSKPEIEFDVIDSIFPTSHYLGQKQIVKWADMETHTTNLLQNLYPLAQDIITGPVSDLYWSWDEENQQTEMTSALPVSISDSLGNFANYTVDSSKCLVINYYGNYNYLNTAHEWMGYHMQSKGIKYKPGVLIHQYVTGPKLEADTSKWLTKVIYFVE